MKANMADVRIISFTTADPNHQVEFLRRLRRKLNCRQSKRPGRREAAGVRLPPNRYAHAALRAILTNETGWTTHSILRIASWIAKIGGSIKRKIPLRGIVAVIWDANRSVRFRIEITVRTLSHQWSSCKNGPAEKAGRDGRLCNSPHWGIPRHSANIIRVFAIARGALRYSPQSGAPWPDVRRAWLAYFIVESSSLRIFFSATH
jgi:hypothetical protein